MQEGAAAESSFLESLTMVDGKVLILINLGQNSEFHWAVFLTSLLWKLVYPPPSLSSAGGNTPFMRLIVDLWKLGPFFADHYLINPVPESSLWIWVPQPSLSSYNNLQRVISGWIQDLIDWLISLLLECTLFCAEFKGPEGKVVSDLPWVVILELGQEGR